MRSPSPFLESGCAARSESCGSTAFSLVEVVIALGIISFAMVAILGLLPVGLSAQRQAVSRAQCVQMLSALSDAARGTYIETNGSTNFPYPLSGIAFGTAGETSLMLLGNGMITNSVGNVTDARGKIFVKQYAVTANNIMPLYVSVAWPAAAVHSDAGWQKAQGSVESLIFVSLP